MRRKYEDVPCTTCGAWIGEECRSLDWYRYPIGGKHKARRELSMSDDTTPTDDVDDDLEDEDVVDESTVVDEGNLDDDELDDDDMPPGVDPDEVPIYPGVDEDEPGVHDEKDVPEDE